MEKKIHYCWFGGKKLPQDVKKCIKSWKKMLPDYEIKEWNEQNFDINICPFVKEAYENKKWAFVSDYARIYALYKESGIYFDTDMKVIKDVSNIIDKEMFLGYEDSGYIGTAVIGTKEKNNPYLKEILDYYNNLEHFYVQNIYNYANPVIITKILEKYNSTINEKGIKIYDNNVYVYPREYFYPLSYNYTERVFTENTCMVHLFNATWTSLGERRTVAVYRKFGLKWGNIINKAINKLGDLKAKIIGVPKKTIKYCINKYSIHMNKAKRVNEIKKQLENKKERYIVICYPEYGKVKESIQKSLEDNVINIKKVYTDKEAEMIANEIIKSGKDLVIFNSLEHGWENIIVELKNIKPQIKIKLLIHNGNALLSGENEWNIYEIMHDLYKKSKIDELVFLKKSLYNFYKAKGYNASLLINDVSIKNKEEYMQKEKNNDTLKIGLYNLDDKWDKNIYNQLSAISLFQNAKLDCEPINYKISTIARKFNINFDIEGNNSTQEEMYKRIAQNDINLYVTFTESAPLMSIESLELGTICLTGDNHHYFEGTELEKYLVVKKEDDIIEIYNKMKVALENKQKILDLYVEWKIEHSKKCKKSVEELLKI